MGAFKNFIFRLSYLAFGSAVRCCAGPTSACCKFCFSTSGCPDAALSSLHFSTSGKPPYLLAVAAQALPSDFLPSRCRSQPSLGYALHQHRTVSLVSHFNRCGFVFFRAARPNDAIKGTSVETLDSCELSSGASVPYLGC